ncbi:MAG: YegS/Rv2252/BmrU family lipid kinase [Oscillospiraceae bacterium]|nr:YegS/Rv2252/BmrU family lipid kinase [Oscillospiraceae bacterium]
MNRQKLLLIVNPYAGKMKAGGALLDLISEFSSHKYDVTVFPTMKKSDAREKVVRDGADYDLIVCCGGDGTVSETVNGIAALPSPPPFSFIPSGTVNDFANTMTMPSDLKQAARRIISGKNRPLDIGAFNSKFFIYVAAFGLFTSVSYTVPQDAKKMFGQLSYVMEGIKQAIEIPSHRMTVKFNNRVIKDDFVVGLVTNSTSVAGLFKIDKARVRLDDGKFELLLVKNPENPIILSQIFVDLTMQRYDPDYVIFERVSDVSFRSEKSIAWCLDGESGGNYKKAAVTNLHKKGVIRI